MKEMILGAMLFIQIACSLQLGEKLDNIPHVGQYFQYVTKYFVNPFTGQ